MERHSVVKHMFIRRHRCSKKKACEKVKRFLHRRRVFERRQDKQRLIFAFVCVSVLSFSIPRSVWQRDRDTQWWEEIVKTKFTAQDWQTNFRMSHNTFLYLCNELRVEIAKTDTSMRKSIPVEKRVAITLWFMSTNSDYAIYLVCRKHQYAKYGRRCVTRL